MRSPAQIAPTGILGPLYGLGIILLLISSCGVEPSDIDLQPLLVKPGDLSGSLTAGPVQMIEPRSDVLCHDQAAEQEIRTRDGDLAAMVYVYLFQSKADCDRAYELFSLVESQEGLVPYAVAPIGDRTSARRTDEGGFEVVFGRCQAVAVITAQDLTFEDELVHYARQLDRRLVSAVCP
jgi:hypothetical protein